MLASQLCVFDDKTDSESKWVENSVWLCCIVRIVCFVKISICDVSSLFNDDAGTVKASRLNSRN